MTCLSLTSGYPNLINSLTRLLIAHTVQDLKFKGNAVTEYTVLANAEHYVQTVFEDCSEELKSPECIGAIRFRVKQYCLQAGTLNAELPIQNPDQSLRYYVKNLISEDMLLYLSDLFEYDNLQLSQFN